jgi:hypothetical protein
MTKPLTLKKPLTVGSFISTLFFSRTQAHIFHLSSTGPGSYARHIALEGYYTDIVNLVDGLAESYQGTYGIITDYNCSFSIESDVVTYFEKLLEYVNSSRKVFGSESDLQNTVDEIVSLIKGTLYKLKNLR